jgi:hypothetical protein
MARDIAKKAARRIKSEARSKLRNKKPHTSSSRLVKSPRSKRKPVVIVKAGQLRRIISRELSERNRPDIATSYTGSPPEHADIQSKLNLDEKEPVLDKVAANRNRVLFDPSK